MNKPLRCRVLLIVIVGLCGLLQACQVAPGVGRPVEIPTPIPAYVATDQASALQARATRQASEGKLAELAAESTAVVLRMTESAATEIYFARQTEQERATTATAAQQAIEATATAQAALHTQAALNAAGTATQAAYNHQATADQAAYNSQATATSIALGVLQASATAQVERIAEQREAERQTLLFRTWAGRIALVILFAVTLFIVWKSLNWVLLRVFGIHRLVNRPVVITPNGKGGFNVFDVSRSMDPGASVSGDGQVLTAGGAGDRQLQSQVAARAQAAELMLAANAGQGVPPGQRRSLLRLAFQAANQANTAALPAGEIVDAEVVILPPDDPRMRPLLDEVETKLLTGGNHS